MNKGNNNYNSIIDTEKLLYKIISNVKNKRPTSVVRKGDGENIIIGYGICDGIKFKKYLKKLRHFNIRYLDVSFQKLFKNELIESYLSSDFLGVPLEQHYLGYTSSVRKYDFEISNYYGLDTSKKLIDSHFHLEFVKNPNNSNLKNNLAQNLISNKKIGIISHFNVNSFLEQHSSIVIKQLSIPKRDAGFFNKMSKNKFNSIKNEILIQKNEIDIWFVAAGAYAKPFCNYIKNTGSIAIDIGSAIDTWVGEYHSRKYLQNMIFGNK